MRICDLLLDEAVQSTKNKNGSSVKLRIKDLELTLQAVKCINKSLVLAEVLELVLDNAIKLARAERGFLILLDDDKKLQCVLASDAQGKLLSADRHTINETIVHDVFTTGESICVDNNPTGGSCDRSEGMKSSRSETILCSPLIVRNEKIGVVYVDSRFTQPVELEEVVDLFEALAGQAAIAIKNAMLFNNLQNAFQDLEEANQHLIKSERMVSKGEMVAEISHELKNLINVVLLQMQSLERSMSKNPSLASSPEIQKVQNSIASVFRISEFATRLLDSSPAKVEKTCGNINENIKHVVKFIKTLKRYSKATLKLSLDETIPSLPFDEKQMHQVLLNLLNNSVEACEDCTIQIETKYYPAKELVQIAVSDNGPGIEQEVLKQLLKSKITTKPNGHGYGLPICRKIIENHGGTMEVESAVNQGATFYMTLSVKDR
jgi:signal transduction histidine kinase